MEGGSCDQQLDCVCDQIQMSNPQRCMRPKKITKQRRGLSKAHSCRTFIQQVAFYDAEFYGIYFISMFTLYFVAISTNHLLLAEKTALILHLFSFTANSEIQTLYNYNCGFSFYFQTKYFLFVWQWQVPKSVSVTCIQN